jgi:hypothetical protein
MHVRPRRAKEVMNMANHKSISFVLLAFLLTAGRALNHAERVSEPRIRPIDASQWTDVHRKALASYAANGEVPSNHSLATCARNPELCRSWLAFASYIEGNTSILSRRDRAIIMLRTAWLCREDYHWGYGVRSAERAGMSRDEILRTTKGPEQQGWSASDSLLLRAVDELHKDQFITDTTWKGLSQTYDERQLLDVVFTVGQYTMVSMFHNSAGVQREPGIAGLPK